MTIEFHCPNCDKLLRTSDEKAGARAKCPQCHEPVTVPTPAPAATGDDEFDFGSSETEAEENYGASELPPRVGGGNGDGMKLCPMCGEMIKAAATRCRYCGEDLGGVASGGRANWRHSRVDVGDVISTSWEIYKSQLGHLVGGVFLVGLLSNLTALPSNILQAILENQQLDEGEALLMLGLIFFFTILAWVGQIYFMAGQHIFLLKIARGQTASIGDLFAGGPYLLRALGNTFVFGLMIGLGFVACVVPGILLTLMFWPYLYVLVDTNARGLEPITRSREITRENWGSVFVLGLAMVGINILGFLALCVGLIFTSPLTLLFFAVAYCRMTGQRTAAHA